MKWQVTQTVSKYRLLACVYILGSDFVRLHVGMKQLKSLLTSSVCRLEVIFVNCGVNVTFVR